MDIPILNLIGPCQDGSLAMIDGDVVALTRLRTAIDAAIANNIGMAELFSFDYEPFDVLVVAPPHMGNVCTACCFLAFPQQNQTVRICLDPTIYINYKQ